MLAWSAEAAAAAEGVEAVVVAAPEGHEEEVRSAVEGAVQSGAGAGTGGGVATSVVAGGGTRSESVAAALSAAPEEMEAVLVHDAARPLARAELFEALLAALAEDQVRLGVVAATPVTETVKEAMRGRVVTRTLDRSRLWAAQTPQAFRIDALREAIERNAELLAQATDDAMLVERLTRGEVLVHEAPRENLKVTTPLDLRVAEALLSER